MGTDRGTPLVPGQFLTQAGPFRIWTNSPIPADTPAVRDLFALERAVQSELGIRIDPEATPIEVYVLDDGAAFRRFLKYYYPQLPPRRAFFLARDDRRVVYTYYSDHLDVDLRHEATHALLHASIPGIPLWLDEGLAEYFEPGTRAGGVNPEHVARLPADLESGWKPDLARLEGLQDVRAMTPRDYRESWLWVHFLLEGPQPNRGTLLGYLADLQTHAAPEPLSGRIDPTETIASTQVIAHLAAIPERPLIVRSQSPATDAAEPAAPRRVTIRQAPEPPRGPITRFLDLFRLRR